MNNIEDIIASRIGTTFSSWSCGNPGTPGYCYHSTDDIRALIKECRELRSANEYNRKRWIADLQEAGEPLKINPDSGAEIAMHIELERQNYEEVIADLKGQLASLNIYIDDFYERMK